MVDAQVSRWMAAAAVAMSLTLAALEAPDVVRTARQVLSAPGAPTTVRELAPAQNHEVSTMALQLAAATIPREATYTVVVGDEPPLDEGIAEAVVPLFEYWLLPRRYTPDQGNAQWIVTYHESTERLHANVARELGLGPDANAVEVRP